MATTLHKPLGDVLAKLERSRARKTHVATPAGVSLPLNEPVASAQSAATDGSKDASTVANRKRDAQSVTLELWPDQVRGVPNAALRGSLFSISQERSIAKKRELLTTVGGVEIRFKGERFNQTDLDVLEMLLHYARTQPLESHVSFSATSLLTNLDRKTGGQDHEQLKEEMARLQGGVVEITWTKQKKTFSGTLLKHFYRDESTQAYVVIFDAKMVALYDDGYTYVDWQERRALGKNNLAKWLHGFYASHAEPFAYKVATLKSLCGSNTKRLGDFRKALKNSLDELKAVGAIIEWQLDQKSDLVLIVKKPSREKTVGGN